MRRFFVYFRKILKKCLHFRICCYIMSSLNELRSVLRTVHINMLSTLFFFINISTGKTTGSARRFSFSRLFFPAFFFSAFCPCFFLSFFARTFHLPFSEPVFVRHFCRVFFDVAFAPAFKLSPFIPVFQLSLSTTIFLFVAFSLRFSRLQKNTVFGSLFFTIFRQKNNLDKSGNAC